MTSAPADLGVNGDLLKDAVVLQAGCGNIGSHLAGNLAAAGVKNIRLVDPDRVEAKNLLNQAYGVDDLGSFKVDALKKYLSRQFPDVSIETHPCRLEELPLAMFQVNVLLGALDTRLARQALISERGWRLHVPVVDGGIGERLQGRVQVFMPGRDTACLECGWSDEDYRLLAEEYPCIPGAAPVAPPTNLPLFIGAATASIMTVETLRILTGQAGPESREIAFNLWSNRLLVSRLKRAPACRFHQHLASGVVSTPRGF
jgi:hypothetical protein